MYPVVRQVCNPHASFRVLTQGVSGGDRRTLLLLAFVSCWEVTRLDGRLMEKPCYALLQRQDQIATETLHQMRNKSINLLFCNLFNFRDGNGLYQFVIMLIHMLFHFIPNYVKLIVNHRSTSKRFTDEIVLTFELLHGVQ